MSAPLEDVSSASASPSMRSATSAPLTPQPITPRALSTDPTPTASLPLSAHNGTIAMSDETPSSKLSTGARKGSTPREFAPDRTATSTTPPPPPTFTPSPSPSPHHQSASLAASQQSPRSGRSHSPPSLSSSSTPREEAESLPMDRADSHASEISASASSSGLRRPTAARSKVRAPPQLVDHLPLAYDAAMSTFTEIAQNDYHDKKLGRPPGKFDDHMLCDCHPLADDESLACTDESGCINRMTQIECSPSRCRWGKLCRNQRFNRRQYASIEIVQTEKKGFGLRAAQQIPKDSFVYEYIGEVMNQPTFLQRMQQYRVEGIRHFYFMMLQPNEYLDATKKGGKARFINHSCNPNCSVSKWQVGKHLRMGIFAKRDIQKGEELTFNYNVDRYGNDAQECYCGEPNCVGTLGGKTQTDLSGMDDLFLDALGIADEVEQTEAKGSRRKRGKRLDLDYIPKMRPIKEHEATKVMTAARQAGPKREILEKLLRRMEMTDDVNVQKALVKLHGFILMQFLLEQWWNDRNIVLLIINVLARWPLIARNKVIDCGVEDQVRIVADTYRPKPATKPEAIAKDIKLDLHEEAKTEPSTTDVKTEDDTETVANRPSLGPDQIRAGSVAPPLKVEDETRHGGVFAPTQPPKPSNGAATTPQPELQPLAALPPPKPDADVSTRAEHLLDAWHRLDLSYRIARREATSSNDEPGREKPAITTWADRRRMPDSDDAMALDRAQAPNAISSELGDALDRDSESKTVSSSSWKPPPLPASMASAAALHPRSKGLNHAFAHGRNSPSSFTPTRMNGVAHSPLTPDQQTAALSSTLAKSLPGLVSSLQQQQQGQVAVPAKSIEDIIREANEQEERRRKEAEAAAKAARELELQGMTAAPSSRKRPSSSSRHADKRHKSSSSSSLLNVRASTSVSTAAGAVSSGHNGGDALAASEKKLRKMVGELVVRQMSKHKDQLERDTFKKYAKELTGVIVSKEMKNPKSWPPTSGTVIADLSNEKRSKIKAFAQDYIGKLLVRKGKGSKSASKSASDDADKAEGSVGATPASAS
ncbi:hypothetical protein BCV70DRAFT_201699 [Testicularia cyperi]|uniref:Histone-lysine N-methyltransferase, H3 lysine-36 specific n=1 Tax=Testicularia cyperi TaxID=1882483 RepID=A0A317XM18_9BASI|nr:hypothetical protein BCV70DRAFT_201699 [Testicularia cyperi]